MRRRPAFSLVETLVVIGIIGVLVAMLLPAVGRARRSADAVKCASNLHQIGIGLFNYAAGWAGSLPSWSQWEVYPDGKYPDDGPNLGWTEQLIPSFGAKPDSPVYDCPSFTGQTPINYFLESRWVAVHDPVRHSIRLAELRLSSLMVLSGDCTNQEFYPVPFGTLTDIREPDCDKDDASTNTMPFANDPGGINMHPAGNNVLFFDGHVSAHRQFDPSDMTYHPTRMQPWADVTPD